MSNPKKTSWNKDKHSCGPKVTKPKGVACGVGLDFSDLLKELLKRKRKGGRFGIRPEPQDN